MDIGMYLNMLLKHTGLTQQQLAELSGITQSNISHICNNRNKPSLETLEKICDSTGISLSAFFNMGEREEGATIARNSSMSIRDAQLIEAFRTLSDRDKAIAESVIRSMAGHTPPAAEKERIAASTLKVNQYKQPKSQHYKRVEGKAAAGLPINSVTDADSLIPVPAKYLSERYFIVQAQGDSMIDAHISDGDYCVFQKDSYFDEGRIMLVQVDGSSDAPDVTIKRVVRRGKNIELHSANAKYPPMTYAADCVQLMGVLIDVITPDH